MISDALPKWIVAILIFLGVVHPQVPMVPMGYGYGGPMMMPPPPMPMPVPMPVPVPVGIPMPYQESTTTTTTTTESNNRDGENGDNRIPIAIPIPVPHFVQIAIPGFIPSNCKPDNKNNGNGNRNKNCPPCPPCSCNPCTPSFFSFCSPCHLECRCKNGKENPSPREPNPPKHFPGPAFPMPIPMPPPGPVVIVPFPAHFGTQQQPRRKPPQDSNCESRPVTDSCSEESKPHDSCESDQSRRKKKRKKGKNKRRNKKKKSNYDIYRRNFDFMRDRSDKRDGLVEPVLRYMSKNGDIKIERRLSNDEASALLGGKRSYGDVDPYNIAEDTYNNVRLTAGEDSYNRPRLVIKFEPGVRSSHRRRQELFFGRSEHLLGEGKKELLFKTPDNKKISNLSVSFQITK